MPQRSPHTRCLYLATQGVMSTLVCLLLLASSAVADVRIRRLAENTLAASHLAIVFVHGFSSSADDAFRHANGTRWGDIIRKDDRLIAEGPHFDRPIPLSSVTLYDVDYASLTGRTSAAGAIGIEDISRTIVDNDDFRAIFRRHERVWFIAHSMGGLVIKRALLKLHAADGGAWRKLLGISLIAVPANGAPLATRASDTTLGAFFRAIWGLSERQLRELTGIDGGNSYLQAMKNDWALFVDAPDRRGLIHLACAYEGSPTSVSGLGIRITEAMVVPQLYSDGKCVGEEARIPADHIQIVKPASRQAIIHEWLFTTLQAAIRNSTVRRQTTTSHASVSTYAAACAAAKDEPNGVWSVAEPDGSRRVTARQSVFEPDIAKQFAAQKVAAAQAKAELVREAKEYVGSEQFVTDTEGRAVLRETVRILASGNLRGVRTLQSCYVNGVAWVKVEHHTTGR